MYELQSKTPPKKNQRIYSKLSKVIFFTTLVFILWMIVVILGIYYLNWGYRWSGLNLFEWCIIGCVFFTLCIIIQLYILLKTKRYVQEYAPQPVEQSGLSFKGKQLYSYTYPSNAKGGFFSKTYILLDENTIIQIRTQILKPEQLWGSTVH